MESNHQSHYVAIACGGTGGHLFPGLAVAEALQQQNCDIALLISEKEVDQEAVKSAESMEIMTLPAVALQNGAVGGFLDGFWKSFRICSRAFKLRKPEAVLAMGGYTSAPPVLAGKRFGAATFLHEANAIPGRANRWLSPVVDQAFVGFPMASTRLFNQAVRVTGMPVRSQFKQIDPAAARLALGLRPNAPVLLVMGGSQGASAINELLARSATLLADRFASLQFLHLTGMKDHDRVAGAYRGAGQRALVRPFLTEMELALGAATVAVSRAGASSLAEVAAMQLPSILIPYPTAVDNHQFFNARSLVETGAARMLEQSSATPELLADLIAELLEKTNVAQAMRQALQRWHSPDAAQEIAADILKRIRRSDGSVSAVEDISGSWAAAVKKESGLPE